MAHTPNGGWQKATMALVTLLSGIAIAWTTAVSEDVEDIDDRQAVTEENMRTIHYEAQAQRKLMKRIAVAVGADAEDIPDVRPLREVE